MLKKQKPLTFLIFSGPTREYIDPVRFISNDSSGKMGAALAKAALKKKNNVIFVTGPAQMPPPDKSKVIRVISALDMLNAVKENLKKADIVIGAAAVADFRPEKRHAKKIKKSAGFEQIKLKKNPDIIAYCGKNKKNKTVAGFALETDGIQANALKKIKEKNLDLIVANGKESLGADKTSVYIICESGSCVKIKNADKNIIAGKIIDETIRIFKSSKTCKTLP